MNLREGTRRLALLLGVAGAIFGGVVSYAQLQSLMRQRADHREFGQLATSQTVQQDRGDVQQTIKRFIPVPIEDGPVDVIGPDGKTYHFPEGTDKDAAVRYFKLEGIGTTHPGIDDPVHQDRIEVIHWSKNFEVESIETQDGRTLYSTPAPGALSYVTAATLPLLGFFIPWGTVRAAGWVVTGFVQPSK
jgi:hypothetical protein